MGNGNGWRDTGRICCKKLRGRNQKCPVGGRGPAEVAKIQTGRFKSWQFWNLEKNAFRPAEREALFCIAVDRDYKVCIIGLDRHADGNKPAAGLSQMAINPQRVYRQSGKNC